jgi:hypothetical protein
MAGFHNQPPYYDIPSSATGTSQSLVEPERIVDLRSLQRCAHDNDQAAAAQLSYGHLTLQHNPTGDPKFIRQIIHLTYNAGDREEFRHQTPQNWESAQVEAWHTKLRPVYDFVRGLKPEFDVGDVELVNGSHAQHAQIQNFVAPALVFNDDYNTVGVASTPIPIDPNLDYVAVPATEPSSTAATPRFIPDFEETPSAGPQQDLTCPHCGSTRCKTFGSLKRHIERQHGFNVSRFSCRWEACGYSSHKRTDLDRHINSIHEKLDTFDCNRCGRAFLRKDNRNRHALKCKA